MSDAGAENKLFFKNLVNHQGFYKLIHVTCLAHMLHNVDKLLKLEFVMVHSLICRVKKIYVNAPKKRSRWKELINPNFPLPVKPVETRWVTWLKAVLYFDKQENRDKSNEWLDVKQYFGRWRRQTSFIFS